MVKIGRRSEYPIDKERLKTLMVEQNWDRQQLSLAITDGANDHYITTVFGIPDARIGSIRLGRLCRLLNCEKEYLVHPEEDEDDPLPAEPSEGNKQQISSATIQIIRDVNELKQLLLGIAGVMQKQNRLTEELLSIWKGDKHE